VHVELIGPPPLATIVQVPVVLHAIDGVLRVLRSETTAIAPGDELLTIDGAPTSTLTFGQSIERLSGRLGDRHLVEIRRDGTRRTVDAEVVAVL
jgi:C-terminal processing protease CtpA/Prc